MNFANLYKKYYASIIYCYLLNNIFKTFIDNIFLVKHPINESKFINMKNKKST